MPLATMHVLEGQYDDRRLSNVSKAVQEALISILKIPAEDFFQIMGFFAQPPEYAVHCIFGGLGKKPQLVICRSKLQFLQKWHSAGVSRGTPHRLSPLW